MPVFLQQAAQPVFLGALDDGHIDEVFQPRLKIAVQEGVAQHALVVVAVQIHVFFQDDLVLGQRARLVRAEHVHLAERLNGGKRFDDGLVLCHVDGALGQRRRHDDGQHLGRQPDCDADGKEQGVAPVVFEKSVDEENHGHHDEHEAQQQFAHRIHALFKAVFRPVARERLGHGAEIRLAARGHDHRRGAAADHVAAHKAQVCNIRQRIRPILGLAEFFHRVRFSRQRRLGHESVFGREEQHVAGQHVPGREPDDIPRDDLRHVKLGIDAVAQDIRLVGDHGRELGGGRRAALALDERDDAGDQNQPDDDKHRRPVRPGREHDVRDKRNRGNEKQNDVEGVDKRLCQPGEKAALLAGCDDVLAEFLQSLLGLLVRQAGMQGNKGGERVVRGQVCQAPEPCFALASLLLHGCSIYFFSK